MTYLNEVIVKRKRDHGRMLLTGSLMIWVMYLSHITTVDGDEIYIALQREVFRNCHQSPLRR